MSAPISDLPVCHLWLASQCDRAKNTNRSYVPQSLQQAPSESLFFSWHCTRELTPAPGARIQHTISHQLWLFSARMDHSLPGTATTVGPHFYLLPVVGCGGQRPRMLLNIPQCTGQPPFTELCSPTGQAAASVLVRVIGRSLSCEASLCAVGKVTLATVVFLVL